MKRSKEFCIFFLGLKYGTHHYSYLIDKQFFESYEYEDIKDCTIQVELCLRKSERLLELDFNLHGSIELLCQRCLDLYQHPINIEEKIIAKLYCDKTGESEDVSVYLLSHKEQMIDVSKFIYELIVLSLPMVNAHPQNEKGEYLCNNETKAILSELLV